MDTTHQLLKSLVFIACVFVDSLFYSKLNYYTKKRFNDFKTFNVFKFLL